MRLSALLSVLILSAVGVSAAEQHEVLHNAPGMVARQSDEIVPGDIVAVNHGPYGRKEGLVIGSSVDYAGRQVVEVQFEPGELYKAWYPYPHVRRIRRTISYGSHNNGNANGAVVTKPRTVERLLYW